jgi:hypothetical protein
MLPRPVYHSAFQFQNTHLGWKNQCNNYKNACINRLWKLDFWMKPKNFAVQYSQWQTTSMQATIPDTPRMKKLLKNVGEIDSCDPLSLDLSLKQIN